MSGIDWGEIERAGAAQIVAAVRAVRDEFPNEHAYGAMVHEFYGDGDVIYWPMVTVGTEESLAEVAAEYAARRDDDEDHAESLRWSGPDLAHGFEPGDPEQALADAVQAAAPTDDFAVWERNYDRFLRCFAKAAKLARKRLVADGVVGKDFIAIAADEAGDLVPLSLSKAQLLRHFPQYDADEQERVRLAVLPPEQRVAELLPEAVAPTYSGLIIGEHEDLLVACGIDAVPALVRVVNGAEFPAGDVTAARLLAEINLATPEAIAALDALMRRDGASTNARAWAASALARMDRSDLILAQLAELPPEVAVRGLADPLRSFRDRGAHRVLNYEPLETALREHPALQPDFEEELAPGVGYCAITAAEVPIARAALDSPFKVLRRHAKTVLKNAGVKDLG